MSCVTMEIGALRLHFESPEDMDAQLGRMSAVLTEKDMATIAGVSERTIRRWKRMPSFPRISSSLITRQAFLRFLFQANQAESRQSKRK